MSPLNLSLTLTPRLSNTTRASNSIIDFTREDFQYEGEVDTAIALPQGVTTAGSIEWLYELKLLHKISFLKPDPTKTVFVYSRLGNVKVTFQWEIDRGYILTYGECRKAIEILMAYLNENAHINGHPIDVTVSGYDTHISTEGKLEFYGISFPGRDLQQSAVKAILQDLKYEFDRMTEHGHPPAVVHDPTFVDHSLMGISVDVDISKSPVDPFPQFNYQDLADLMVAIEGFYQNRGRGFPLYGDITYKGDERVDVGALMIDESNPDQAVSDTLANGTVATS
ncbi:uncharacterized protein KY384_001276 [Bacidia gigantensis]|uniref:uncharacterized protein n=1 Tax=Bacidia gigantensis TaxID=2732470 RepID=UPI001D0553A1|nr:uncharacterized protein KY384_001276 [Bacidia gigantensis]KAG8533536.1 hypothetical protein KY384_001276 [Bacidia gigantensis]